MRYIINEIHNLEMEFFNILVILKIITLDVDDRIIGLAGGFVL